MKQYAALWCLLLGLSAFAQEIRPITQVNDINRVGQEFYTKPVQWFAGDSIRFDVYATDGRNQIDLSSGIFPVLYVSLETNVQQVYLVQTGIVVNGTSGHVRVSVPAQRALLSPTNSYASWMTVYRVEGGATSEVATVAYSATKVLPAPNGTTYTYLTPTNPPFQISIGAVLVNPTNWSLYPAKQVVNLAGYALTNAGVLYGSAAGLSNFPAYLATNGAWDAATTSAYTLAQQASNLAFSASQASTDEIARAWAAAASNIAVTASNLAAAAAAASIDLTARDWAIGASNLALSASQSSTDTVVRGWISSNGAAFATVTGQTFSGAVVVGNPFTKSTDIYSDTIVFRDTSPSKSDHIKIRKGPTADSDKYVLYKLNNVSDEFSDTYTTNKIWSSDIDGSGSGLDADTVDGLTSEEFARRTNSTPVVFNDRVVIGGITLTGYQPSGRIPPTIGINNTNGATADDVVITRKLGQPVWFDERLNLGGVNPWSGGSGSGSIYLYSEGDTSPSMSLTITGGLRVGQNSFHADLAGNISQDATNTASLGIVTGVLFRAASITGAVIGAGVFIGSGTGLTGVATGSPVYVESDPLWTAASTAYVTKVSADSLYASSTGQTFSGTISPRMLVVSNQYGELVVGPNSKGLMYFGNTNNVSVIYIKPNDTNAMIDIRGGGVLRVRDDPNSESVAISKDNIVFKDASLAQVMSLTITGGLRVGQASFHADLSGNIYQDATNTAVLGVVSGVSFRADAFTGTVIGAGTFYGNGANLSGVATGTPLYAFTELDPKVSNTVLQGAALGLTAIQPNASITNLTGYGAAATRNVVTTNAADILNKLLPMVSDDNSPTIIGALGWAQDSYGNYGALIYPNSDIRNFLQLGSAALSNAIDFATAAQGATADSAYVFATQAVAGVGSVGPTATNALTVGNWASNRADSAYGIAVAGSNLAASAYTTATGAQAVANAAYPASNPSNYITTAALSGYATGTPIYVETGTGTLIAASIAAFMPGAAISNEFLSTGTAAAVYQTIAGLEQSVHSITSTNLSWSPIAASGVIKAGAYGVTNVGWVQLNEQDQDIPASSVYVTNSALSFRSPAGSRQTVWTSGNMNPVTVPSGNTNYWRIVTPPASSGAFGAWGYLSYDSTNIYIYHAASSRWLRVAGTLSW